MNRQDLEWKNLQYYKDIVDIYIISNYGDVKNKNTGKLLKPYIDKDGYVHITLSTLVNGKKNSRHYPVHRLVAFNFKNDFKIELTVNHDDDNKTNNYYKNFTMMTIGDNVKQAYKTGANKIRPQSLKPNEKDTNNGKPTVVTEEIAHEISKLIASGLGSTKIFNIIKSKYPFIPNVQHVEKIKKKIRWIHISDKYFIVERKSNNRTLIIKPVNH